MMRAIARSGEGSFLAVLKTFGPRPSVGLMSFPRPGITLALDFANNGQRTERLFERIDAIVREVGGRIYPAKDARMPVDLFESGFPALNEFIKFRDPNIWSTGITTTDGEVRSGSKKHIVIVGATSSIGAHCARLWVQREAAELTLIGRDLSRLEHTAMVPQSSLAAVRDFVAAC